MRLMLDIVKTTCFNWAQAFGPEAPWCFSTGDREVNTASIGLRLLGLRLGAVPHELAIAGFVASIGLRLLGLRLADKGETRISGSGCSFNWAQAFGPEARYYIITSLKKDQKGFNWAQAFGPEAHEA